MLEATEALGIPPSGNTLLGAAPPAGTTCSGPVDVNVIDGFTGGAEDFNVAVSAPRGGFCRGLNCSGLPNGSVVRVALQRSQIECIPCPSVFGGTIEDCICGPVFVNLCGSTDFRVDTRNGCVQELQVNSCNGNAVAFEASPILVPGGSWYQSCDEDSFSPGTNLNAPTLCASCAGPVVQLPREIESCATCSSGIWGNSNGTFVCN